MSEGRTAAQLLREMRIRQGRTLQEVSDQTGIAVSQLSRLERGQRKITEATQPRLAEYYGIDPDVLALADGQLPERVRRVLLDRPDELSRLLAMASNEGDSASAG